MKSDNTRAADAQIRERILAALRDDKRTAGATIEVVSQQGVVTLKGRVESDSVRKTAEAIASAQQGVTLVVNDLATKEPAEEVEPLVDVPGPAEVAALDTRAPYIPDLDKSEEE